MTNSLEDPIESGPQYRITEVDRRNPGMLDDFAGENTFTIIKDGVVHSVFGTGIPMIDSIRFYQKDSTPAARDIRVWKINQASDGTFHARHVAAF